MTDPAHSQVARFKPARERTFWIDLARGLCILLVVFGHAWRNAAADRLLAPATFETVDRAIYLFHMPAFFLLSGLFLHDLLARRGIVDFLKSRPRAILVPLLFWAYFQALLRVATEGSTGLATFAATPLRADTIFWFLWVLLACQILTAILTQFSARAMLMWTASALCAVAIVLLPRDDGSLAYRFAEMFPFYAAGTLIRAARWQQGRVGALAGTLMFVLAQVAAAFFARTAPSLYLCAVIATTGCLLFCASIDGPSNGLLRGLAFLGRWSMAIYLLHVPLLAVHIFLTRWGLTDPALQLTLATALAIGGSLVGRMVLMRFGFSILLGERPIHRPGRERASHEQPRAELSVGEI